MFEALQDVGLWIGIALAVPLSVVGNLVTPWIKNRVARSSAARSAKRLAELRAELDDLTKLAADPAKHQIFLLESILLLTLLTSFMAVIAGALYVLADVGFPSLRFFQPMSRLFAIVAGIAVAKECMATLRKSARVRRFDEYRQRAEAQLRRLESTVPPLG